MASDLEEDRDALLATLQANGRQFMASFGQLATSSKKRLDHDPPSITVTEPDEWYGIGSDSSQSYPSSVGSEQQLEAGSDGQCDDELDEDEDTDAVERSDDEFRSDEPSKQAHVVVFSSLTKPHHERLPPTKSQTRAFMSSKISKLREDVDERIQQRTLDDVDEYEEERTHLQNDSILHRLVHTSLLSGSANPELNLKPSQRRKALVGRVLELAGEAKLGKGLSIVQQEELNKASKKVRLGIQRKKKEKSVKELEEAKIVGNYHPGIKRTFEASSTEQPTTGKRKRGLKLGVGKFAGGVLKLSREEINSIQGRRSMNGSNVRGRGRGRGRRSGK